MEDVLANAKYSNFRLVGSDPFDPGNNHDDQFFKDVDPVTLFDLIQILTSNSSILESLGMVMMAGSKEIQKEACQIISNIAARMEGLIEKMHTAGLIEHLCRLLEKDEPLEKDEFDVKMEATWAIYNGIYGSEFPASRPSVMERE